MCSMHLFLSISRKPQIQISINEIPLTPPRCSLPIYGQGRTFSSEIFLPFQSLHLFALFAHYSLLCNSLIFCPYLELFLRFHFRKEKFIKKFIYSPTPPKSSTSAYSVWPDWTNFQPLVEIFNCLKSPNDFFANIFLKSPKIIQIRDKFGYFL
jgi:hypothetical protein